MTSKLNCWEFHNCTEGMNDLNSEELKCKVVQAAYCDGVNEGKNGGRICWSIVGTLCHENHKGCFTKSVTSCLECKFYKVVLKEERDELLLLPPLN